MTIAQMSLARLRFAPGDPRVAEFFDNLDAVYQSAAGHPGFIWRLPDVQAAHQLAALGHDDRTSATVSVWRSVADLHDFTFSGAHGEFFDRRAEWFEKFEGPQLVIWRADATARPDFGEAFARLERLRRHGPTDHAHGWPARPDA